MFTVLLQEITKKYVMQNLTSEQLEELAETGHPAFDLLPLSQDKKKAILKRVAIRLAESGDSAFDSLSLSEDEKRAIMNQVVFTQHTQMTPVKHTPATLKESTLHYIVQNITLSELEQIAETNPTVLDVLPLSESVKREILDRVATRRVQP